MSSEFNEQMGGNMEMESNKEVNQIYQSWREIVKNPEVLTDLSEKDIIFTAGGGMVVRFGDEKSGIWNALVTKAVNEKTQIAGIEFAIKDLALMGDYYRFLKDKGFNFHCIDERLEGDEQHLQDEVHCKCGACLAVGAASGLDNVEDLLLTELEQSFKQDVYSDMPDHESLVVSVDLRGADVVLGEKREELKQKKALAFNVSLPLDMIQEWSESRKQSAEALIPTLVKWNVQIARNIIEGHHNIFHEQADQTLIVVDQRGVEKTSLLSLAQTEIQKVQHKEILEIAA